MTDIDERMERYLAGDMTREDRVAFEDEILSKPELSDRLYADVNVRTAIEDAARTRRELAVAAASAVPWWRRPMLRWLAPAAAVAAAAVVVLVMRPTSPDGPPVFRGDETTIEGFSPRGTVVAAPQEFEWRPIEGAAYYRFELFDAASIEVFATTTDQTRLTVDAIPVPSAGYWVVTPLNDVRAPVGDARVIRYASD